LVRDRLIVSNPEIEKVQELRETCGDIRKIIQNILNSKDAQAEN